MRNIKSILFLVLTITFISCENNGKAKGYYKVLNHDVKENQAYNQNPQYFRINEDTLVAFSIKDLTVDSTRFVWNGQWYENYDDKPLNGLKITFNGKDNIPIEVFKMGNSIYETIDENKVTFSYDTTQLDINEMGNEFFEMVYDNKDTLQEVDNRYIDLAIAKDYTKDSLLYYKPYITIEFVREQIQGYIMQNYNSSTYQVNKNSLAIYRKSDNEFDVQFFTEGPYGITSDYTLQLNFNKESVAIDHK